MGLNRANEAMAAYMSEKDAIRDREQFVRNLGDLLSQTRDGVVSCELVDAERDTEHVLVTYKGGGTRKINTYMDSYAAIVRDVARRFQQRRTKTGKTKAEEYVALSQIRGILKDFDPEDTYIGKAFEGCVEQAEENICNDWMFSFRSRYESMDRDAAKLDENLTEVTKKLRESEEARVELVKELNQKDDAIARLEDAKNQLESQIVGEALIRRDYEARIGQMESDYKALQISYEGLKAAKKQEAAAEVHALRQTILELKAKLYDMMTGKEVEE